MSSLPDLQPATATDLADIERLNARAFGPGRHARTAARVRELAPSALDLSVVARCNERLVGAVQQSRIVVGGDAGVWLGPITVTETGRRAGVGAALMRAAIAAAEVDGAKYVLLIGDAPYYGRFGFRPVPAGSIALPGPANPARFLGLVLTPLGLMPQGTLRAAEPSPQIHHH